MSTPAEDADRRMQAAGIPDDRGRAIPLEHRLQLGLESGYELPFPYAAEWNDKPGVYCGASRITYAVLLPVRLLVDPDDKQLLELAWLDGGRWVRRTVSRRDAASGRRLVAALGDAGLPVTEADAKTAERFIACTLASNASIGRDNLVRWLGWQPDGSFIASPAEARYFEPAYDEQVRAAEAHRQRGSLAGWRAAVAPLASYPAAQMGLYAGLAAPLLEVLADVNSFTVDISGRSSRGKTTTVMAGLSPWADPSDKAEAMYHWRTTMIALEKRLNLVRGLPVVVDETRVVKEPELVDQVLYQVPKNHGTPRGGGWPSLLPWQTIVLSTGEQSALSFTTHEGASARVLSVREAPFGYTGADSATAAEHVARGCCDNYGIAGPEFVRNLIVQLADPGGKAQLRKRHQALAETVQGETTMSHRRAPMLATLMLAAELAYEWEIVPFAPPSADVWCAIFAHIEDQRDDRPAEALDLVREFVAARGRELWVRTDRPDAQPTGGWAGRYITHDGRTTVALLPDRLRKILASSGYQLDAVLPGWKESGAILTYQSQRPSHMVARALAGAKPKMIIFAPGVVPCGDSDADEE